MKETVRHPSHYNTGKIEVIDFLEDQKLPPNLWNTVKYTCRAKHKGQEIDDLRKAEFYVHREIQIRKWPDLTSKQADARERRELSKSSSVKTPTSRRKRRRT